MSRQAMERALRGGLFVIAAAGGAVAGCGGGACDKAVDELAGLQPATVRDAPKEALAPWKAKLDHARTTCAAEGKAGALERIGEVDHAITMRSADLAIEAGTRAQAAVSASAAPAPRPVWTVRCADVVRDGGFVGLLPVGVPREVASQLVAGAADAGARPPPDEALLLASRPVYLAARGGKLEGSIFGPDGFEVQQSLGWPAEAAGEGAIGRIVAAKGPDVLGVAWVSNLSVFFATLDIGTESWTSFGELPVSGDDGGRDLVLGDLAWGRASFGLVLGTARGFAFIEVLPTSRAVRPAALQPAFIAGTPRIAWDGQRFMIAAGSGGGQPSMGLWRAPDGASPGEWMPLVQSLAADATLEPLTGELLAQGGAVHLAFQIANARGKTLHLGHAVGGGPAELETCP